MKVFSTRSLGLAALLMASPLPVAAQGVFVAPPTPNADQLAIQMRALAADPGNVHALLTAGELSVRLEDPAAALQFFARAEKIDPGNVRIPVGRAGALVRLGRPGEALRLLAEAERRGAAASAIAPQRALAYDLIGQPRHAQAEYARALAAQPGDADLTRSLALSQAIAGDQAGALATLDPLLRQQDRSAWRVRAFALAMQGDIAGAQGIANAMMPGFGTSFTPFFQQLSRLKDPADRAFAVHRGEVGRTPQRMADATMAPALPGLAIGTPVRLAAVTDTQAPRETASRTRSDRGVRSARNTRRTRERQRRPASIPARSAPAVALAAAAPTPTVLRAPVRVAATSPYAASPVRIAIAAPPPMQRGSIDPASVVRVAVPNSGEDELRAAATRATNPIVSRPLVSGSVAASPGFGAMAAAGGGVPAAPVGTAALVNTTPLSVPPVPARPVAVAANVGTIPSIASVRAPVTTPLADSGPARAAVGREDDRLAAILRGIAIPAEELNVRPMPGAVAEPTVMPVARMGTTAPAALADAPAKPRADKPTPEVGKPVTARAEAATPAAKREIKKPAVTAETKKPVAKKAPAKPVEPARYWVQVAGGANKSDLPKEWKRLSGLAPAAMKGKTAWTTPLRFTNRLLAGPFASEGEAQTFVNALGKQGISTFAWKSEAGQPVEKLPVR